MHFVDADRVAGAHQCRKVVRLAHVFHDDGEVGLTARKDVTQSRKAHRGHVLCSIGAARSIIIDIRLTLGLSGEYILARIVIAGCGDLGTAAGTLLNGDGHEVFGVRRRSGPIADGITPICADLGEPSQLQALPADVAVLIYSAAADGFTDDAYQSAYVSGLRNMLHALDSERLTRVIFVSSTSVYAQDDGGWVTEQSPTQPSGFSGQRLLQAEALVNARECETSIVRFGGIYGAGRTRLLKQVRAGARCRDEPVQWTNRIHRDDCAGVMRHLVGLDAPEKLYLGVDCEPAGQCTVLRWLAQEMGAPEPVEAPAEDDSPRRRRGGNKRCSNQRLLDSGYEFLYPSFRQGYAQMLAVEAQSSTMTSLR